MNFDFRQHPIKWTTIVASVGISIAIGSLILVLVGKNPAEVFSIIASGAVGSEFALSSTLRWMTPILICGVASAISFRGGMFNMGIEGQMYLGAFFAALAGHYLQGLPTMLHLPACLLAGMLFGALFALIPALLRYYFDASEMVVGIMMNYVAMYLTDYLVRYHFIAGGTHGTALVTEEIQATARLPMLLSKGQANYGLLIGGLLVLVFYVLIKKSKAGYEIHIVGINPEFARYGGVNVAATQIKIILISGAIAGIAGAVEVMGVVKMFQTRFSPGYGNDGIVAAFLGANTPAGTLIASFVLGALKAGVLSVERYAGVSRALAKIIQAVVLVFISTRMLSGLDPFKLRFRRKAPETAEQKEA